MASRVKVTTVGNSAGIVLPREVLEHLHVDKGDSLYITETRGGIHVTPYSPEFSSQVEVAKRVMRKYRNALRKLAE
jgi:putative addiction module antidote